MLKKIWAFFWGPKKPPAPRPPLVATLVHEHLAAPVEHTMSQTLTVDLHGFSTGAVDVPVRRAYGLVFERSPHESYWPSTVLALSIHESYGLLTASQHPAFGLDKFLEGIREVDQ